VTDHDVTHLLGCGAAFLFLTGLCLAAVDIPIAVKLVAAALCCGLEAEWRLLCSGR
jgi:hypothetical protein